MPTDTNRIVTQRKLSVKQVHVLPPNEKVELPYFDTTGQPTKDAVILYRRHCRLLGMDFRRFPFDPTNWRRVPDTRKEEAWRIMMVIRISKYYNYLKYII